MYKKIILLLICITIAGTFSLFAENKTVFDEHPNALGYAGGANTPNIGGRGMLYQRWFGPIGFQISGMAHNSTNNSELLFNTGATVLVDLYGADFLDWLSGQIYLLGGATFSKYHTYNNIDVTVPTVVTEIEIGGGIGFETVFVRHLAAYLEVVESYNINTGKLNFGPQLGFRFRF